MERRAAATNRPAESLKPPIAGTPSECVEQIRRYVDVGVSLFILRFMGGDFEEEATLFAEEVAPAFS
jgi:alkanesulfonate monooxygenase SsuD/methylene tetrahydromethanopterin reductase-like flavin-dependent oxidoreductase (luciferase family)